MARIERKKNAGRTSRGKLVAEKVFPTFNVYKWAIKFVIFRGALVLNVSFVTTPVIFISI